MIIQSDPGAGYRAHEAEIDAAIKRVLHSGWYIAGNELKAFEAEFAAFLGAGQAIGVGNGTDALLLALRACGVGPGDSVLTVSHTAVATVAAIEMAGATPILADIDPESYTLDIAALRRSLDTFDTRAIKAIIPVHLYGHPVDMPALMELAGEHGWRVIEDCAQSHGATVHGRMTGTWGDAAAFSFYPTKNLGALGDGGAVVTGDDSIAARLRLLREYGWRERYVSEIPGINTRLDELQAAILRVKLRHLAEDNARRRAIAATYSAGLAGSGLGLPAVSAGVEHVFHQYVVRTSERDHLRAALRERGVGTLIHYPMAVHEQPAYAGRIRCLGDMQVTEAAVRQVLSLPIHPYLTDAQVAQVIAAVMTATVVSHG